MAHSSRANKPQLKEVPDVVYDQQNKRYFSKGKFLGKGGFARCYELISMSNNQIYAGKVVSKTLLVKKHQKDKVYHLKFRCLLWYMLYTMYL
jgi:polo-like kinase 1